jgi:hypothetical protein
MVIYLNINREREKRKIFFYLNLKIFNLLTFYKFLFDFDYIFLPRANLLKSTRPREIKKDVIET